MTTDLFIIILQDKSTAYIKTESKRIFDITDCQQPITDNKYGINYNGVLPTAKEVAPEYIADLLTKGASLVFKKRKSSSKKARRRATSKAERRHVVSAYEKEAI